MKTYFALALLVSTAIFGMEDKRESHRINKNITKQVYQCVWSSDYKRLEKLVCKSDIDVNKLYRNFNHGYTPLITALMMENPNLDIISLILKAGSDPNVCLGFFKDFRSLSGGKFKGFAYPEWTAGHFAVAFKCSKEILYKLHEYKCDFLNKKLEWTPVSLAFYQQNLEACQMFYEILDFDGEKLPYDNFTLEKKNKLLWYLDQFLEKNFNGLLCYDEKTGFIYQNKIAEMVLTPSKNIKVDLNFKEGVVQCTDRQDINLSNDIKENLAAFIPVTSSPQLDDKTAGVEDKQNFQNLTSEQTNVALRSNLCLKKLKHASEPVYGLSDGFYFGPESCELVILRLTTLSVLLCLLSYIAYGG